MPRYPNADVLKVAVMANGVFMGTFLGRAPLFAWEVFLAPRMCIGPPLLSMTRSMDNEAASSSHTWKKRGSGPRGWPASCPRPHAGGLLPFSLAPQPPLFRVHGDRRAEAPSPGQGQSLVLPSLLGSPQRPPSTWDSDPSASVRPLGQMPALLGSQAFSEGAVNQQRGRWARGQAMSDARGSGQRPGKDPGAEEQPTLAPGPHPVPEAGRPLGAAGPTSPHGASPAS